MSDGEDEPKPKSQAFDAIKRFTAAAEEAADLPPGKRLVAQAEAFEELTDTLGECYAAGMNVPAGMFAEEVADVSTLTKTDAKETIARKSQHAKTAGRDRPQVHDWIEANLQEVRVRRSTDHVQDTSYIWDFGDVTVETESGQKSREHYGWSLFRDAIKDAGGPYLADPPEELRDGAEWREWIVHLEEKRGDTKVFTGPRTQAVEYLQDRVRASDGFGTVADAADMQGCYVEVHNDPPAGEEPVDDSMPEQECPLWRVELLMVPNNWAVDAAEEYGTTPRGLQIELEARGHTLDGQASVSTREYVGGRWATFWVLNGDFAAPAAYQPEAVAVEPDVDTPGTEAAADGGDDPDRDLGSVGGGSNG